MWYRYLEYDASVFSFFLLFKLDNLKTMLAKALYL